MLWLIAIFTITLIFSVLYYLLKKNYTYWECRGVIQDKPTLLFGSFLNVFLRKQHSSEIIREIYFKYSNQPYVGFYGFTKPLLLVRDPEILKKILIRDFNKFTNRITILNERTDPIAYHSIFNLRDNEWRNMRYKLTPVFTTGKIKMMLPLTMECAENLCEKITSLSSDVIDIKDLINRYTIDVISSCAFGVNSNCLKYHRTEIFENATKFVNPNSFYRNFSILCYLFIPKLVDLLNLTFFDLESANFLFEIFKATLHERQIKNIERNDFINMLNDLKENGKDLQFDDIKMASQAITFFGAGSITTLVTITCTLYELALDKSIQDRLREEIVQSYRINNNFNYDEIHQLNYLNMVICETLRKYPFGLFTNRVANEDYIIEETGLKIDKGTTIITPTFGLHFDPKYYENPQKYDPERFNDYNKHGIVPCTYLPFGEGPRRCLGQRFATLSIKVALIHLIKDFEFDISEITPVPLKMSKTSAFLQTEGEMALKIRKV